MRKLLALLFVTLALIPMAAQGLPGAGLEALAQGAVKQYQIVQGDTLQAVAAANYGDQRLWPVVWWANRNQVKNPERIETGQNLAIYGLPFKAGNYGVTDKILIAQAYEKAYQRYREFGAELVNHRRWVLLEALNFDPAFFASNYASIDSGDLAWYEARSGKKIVAAEPAKASEQPKPAETAQVVEPVKTEPAPTVSVEPAKTAETDATSAASEEWAEEPTKEEAVAAPVEEAVPAHPYAKYVENPLEITIIETTDIHGAIFPYNFITAQPKPTSMAQVASLVAEERAAGSNLVLIDNGDSLQGQPTVYYYNFEKTDVPHIWGEALNYLEYDAVGVGNHDIEAGHPVYDKLYQEGIRAPVICANAVMENGDPYFTPYVVIEREGVKIAILGLISPKIPDWLPPQFWTGMQFEDMVESAKKWIPQIQENDNPDVIIGLFHAGVDYTYGGTNKNTPNNENAAQLVAEQVPGFDAIFVGHDHQGWSGMGWDPAAKKPMEVKDPNGKVVPIFGGLNDARKVPVVKVMLSWNMETETWSKYVRGGLVDLAGYPADPAFMEKFQPAFDEVKAWVDRPVGKMEGKISTQESMFGDSAFVDLIHKIQLEICADPEMGLKPAQISFAAPLAFNAAIPSSADGTLFVRDMFNLYVYENFLYTMTMTGQQVKDFLEYSYKFWFETMPNDGNHIIAYQKDKEGKLVQDARSGAYQTATRYYNYDSAAGINYTVDVSKPAGERVVIESMDDGSAFDPTATYTVAINSYRAQGGGGHLEKGSGLNKADVQGMKYVTSATTKDLRFYLLKWFEKQSGSITVGADGNWKVIPEDLAQMGKDVDLPLLYPAK